MCEGCRKIEEKIAHYREMASYVMDRPTLDSIDVLIARFGSRERSIASEDVTVAPTNLVEDRRQPHDTAESLA